MKTHVKLLTTIVFISGMLASCGDEAPSQIAQVKSIDVLADKIGDAQIKLAELRELEAKETKSLDSQSDITRSVANASSLETQSTALKNLSDLVVSLRASVKNDGEENLRSVGTVAAGLIKYFNPKTIPARIDLGLKTIEAINFGFSPAVWYKEESDLVKYGFKIVKATFTVLNITNGNDSLKEGVEELEKAKEAVESAPKANPDSRANIHLKNLLSRTTKTYRTKADLELANKTQEVKDGFKKILDKAYKRSWGFPTVKEVEWFIDYINTEYVKALATEDKK
ncbi:MAG: CAMP factor family pore-forming toxin [Helicobacteraceae bacterium]